MRPLDTKVFVIQDGTVVETTIGDCSGYIEMTTTPLGVAPCYHTRGNELWTWGHQGNFPRKVGEFETDEEAEIELELFHCFDFWKSDILAFERREHAERALKDLGLY